MYGATAEARGRKSTLSAVARAFLSLETTFATAVCLWWLRLALLHAPRDRSSPSIGYGVNMTWNGDTYVLHWNYGDDRLYTQLNSGISNDKQAHMLIACPVVGRGRLIAKPHPGQSPTPIMQADADCTLIACSVVPAGVGRLGD